MKKSKSFILNMFIMILTAVICSCLTIGTLQASAGVGKQYYGDVDGDGEVLMADAVILQKSVVKLVELNCDKALRGDVNNDGSVTMKDVIYLQRYAAKLVEEFPADSQWSYEITSDGYIDGFF